MKRWKNLPTKTIACLMVGLLPVLLGSTLTVDEPNSDPTGSVSQIRMATVDDSIHRKRLVRRPAAVAWSADERHGLIANRDTGSISVVSIDAGKVVLEKIIGKQLVDICRISESEYLVADMLAHELICVEFRSKQIDLNIKWKIPVVRYPNRIAFDGKNRVLVGGQWSHQLQVLDTSNPEQAGEPIDIPFAPGNLIWHAEQSVFLVAAKFSNQILRLRHSANTWNPEQPKTIDGFSVRGLSTAKDGKNILVSGQVLNELARSTRNDVHWGLMISNEIRLIHPDQLSNTNTDSIQSKRIAIGKDEDGKGDPGQTVVLPDGTLLVLIEGTGQLAIRPPAPASSNSNPFEYIDLGKRPVDIAVDSKNETAIVANMFSDSISIVRLRKKHVDSERKPVIHVALGETKKLTAVQQGELLFFDASLSHDSWLSCHSCHVDAHTNGLRNDNFSDQTFGAPKLVITVLGRVGTEPFAWNGSAENMDQQIKKSIEQTMQSDEVPTEETVQLIRQFLESQQAPPSLVEARNAHRTPVSRKQIANGKAVFQRLNCKQCHQGAALTSKNLEDVGISDELGKTKFNPPSLTAVSQRPLLLHDGRTGSLHTLFAKHRHQLEQELSADDLNSLVKYLQTL